MKHADSKTALYAQIMQNEGEAIVVTDALTRFVDASAGACKLLGYSHAELMRMHVPDLVPPIHKKAFFEALRSGRVGAMKRLRSRPEVLCKGGRLVPVEISVNWLSGGGFLAVFRDISEQVRAEEMSERLIRETPDGFALHEIICDESGVPADYRFLMVNPAFEKITGLRADQIVGRTVLEVMPETEPYWIERYGAVALTGQSDSFEDYSVSLGKHFEVKAFRPCPGQFACVFTDVTDSRLLQSRLAAHADRLRDLTTQLIGAEERRSREIAVELHDRVLQPLAVAKMALQDLAQAAEMADSPQLERALTMVSETLSESRELTREISPAVLHELGLEAGISWLVERAQRYGTVGTETESPALGDLSDEVKAFLFRATRELIANVAKHSGADWFSVSWGRDGDEVWIVVEDCGRGMDVGSRSTSDGFGLFSIEERARQLGGDLTIESAPGCGARVRVSVKDEARRLPA